MTRGQAIRDFCRDCMGNNHSASECDVLDCVLWRYRMRREDKTATGKRFTRGKAIRVKCIECMGGQRKVIHDCPSRQCALWGYRLYGIASTQQHDGSKPSQETR